MARRAQWRGRAAEPHEGEAEEEQPAGRESRRDGEDDQRGDERDQTGRHGQRSRSPRRAARGRGEAIGGDQADHVRATEIDRPAAAQGLSAADEDELLVGAGVGEDFRDGGQAPAAFGELLGGAGGGGAEFERAGAPAAAGAFGRQDDAVLAAGLGDGAGLFERADGGIGAPGGGFEPGGLAALAPLLAELAFGLVEHDEGDAVFAAGVAGAGERRHEAEAGDLVEEEDDPAARQAAVGLIDGVEQGADDDPGERRRRLQHLHRDIDEKIDIAGDEIGGAKPFSPETRAA